MRRINLALLAALALLVAAHFVAAAPAPAEEDLTPKILAFEGHWEKFVRAYWGCPKEATVAAECIGPKYLDYQEFNRAAKQARELFALDDGKRK